MHFVQLALLCWEYFDLKKKALFVVDIPTTTFSVEILATPQEFHKDGTVTGEKPYWVRLSEFPDPMDALCDAIDDQCWSEDEERRKERKSMRRH